MSNCLICGQELPVQGLHFCSTYPPQRPQLPTVPQPTFTWPPEDPKAAELRRVRDAIDRACRVVQALAVPEGQFWEEGSAEDVELAATRDDLCTLRARERALAAEAEKGEPKP